MTLTYETNNSSCCLPNNAPTILLENTVVVHNPRYNLSLVQSEEYVRAQHLISTIINQLIYGCDSQTCDNTACYTYQKRVALKPLRKLSPLSARAKAIHLASQSDVERYLCNDISGESKNIKAFDGSHMPASCEPCGTSLTKPETAICIAHDEDSKIADHSQVPLTSSFPQQSPKFASEVRKDPKSFAQCVFEKSIMRSLDLSQASPSKQSLLGLQDVPLPQSLSHVSKDIQAALYSAGCPDSRYERPLGERLFKRNKCRENGVSTAFLKQSCFYVFGRLEGIKASFRTRHEENDRSMAQSTQDLSLIQRAMEWWHAQVGDLLLISLQRGLEKLDLSSNILEEKPTTFGSGFNDALHVILVCIIATICSSPAKIEVNRYAHPSLAKLGDDPSLNTVSLQLAKKVVNCLFNLYCQVYGESSEPGHRKTLDDTAPYLQFFGMFNCFKHSVSTDKRTLLGLRHWTRMVFLSEWDGHPIIPRISYAGKSLRLLEWLYPHENEDIRLFEPFIMPPFDEYFNSIDIVNQRLHDAQRGSHVHILDFPWLFPWSATFEHFRARCLVRMMDAVDKGELVLQILCNRSVNYFQDEPEPRRILGTASSRNLALFVRRESLLADTFDQLWRREVRELLRPLKVKIEHFGEQGIDEGGVAQEYLRLVFAEACGPDYGLFIVDPGTRMMWFNPDCREENWRFEVLGLLVALAVYNGFTSPFTFPQVLYSKLLGRKQFTLSSIRDGWPELVNGLEALLSWTDGDVSETFLRTYEFSYEAYGKVVSVDIEHDKCALKSELPDIPLKGRRLVAESEASLVTNANRSRYVQAYIFWLTDASVRDQYNAFAKGFYTVLTSDMIKHLNPRELEVLVEGHHEIDIHRLRDVTRYEGYSENSSMIKSFWTIVDAYSQQEKGRLLQFVMATDRIPVLGYHNMEFVIQKNGPDSEQLPSSHTCFGRLLLPEYSSEEKLRKKLRIALENSIGFGLS